MRHKDLSSLTIILNIIKISLSLLWVMLSFLIEIPHLGQLGFKMHLSYAKFVQPYPSDLGTLDRE